MGSSHKNMSNASESGKAEYRVEKIQSMRQDHLAKRDKRRENPKKNDANVSPPSVREQKNSAKVTSESDAHRTTDNNQLLEEARQFVAKAEPEKARQLLEKIIKNDPQNDEALVELGLVYLLDLHESGEAKANFQKAALANSHNEVAISELINIYYEQETIDEGVAFLTDLLNQNPENDQLSLSIGQLYVDSGRYEDSLVHLKTAAESGKNKDLALLELARAYGQLGRRDDEAEALDKAISYKESEILTLSGDLGNPERQAFEQEETRLSLSVAQDSLHYMRVDKAQALIAAGHYDAAEKLINEMRDYPQGDDAVEQLSRHLNQVKFGNTHSTTEQRH